MSTIPHVTYLAQILDEFWEIEKKVAILNVILPFVDEWHSEISTSLSRKVGREDWMTCRTEWTGTLPRCASCVGITGGKGRSDALVNTSTLA